MAVNSNDGFSSQSGHPEYAGIWARAVAVFVDQVIILSAFLVIGVAGLLFMGEQASAISGVLFSLIHLLYWPVMESSARQATFGKKLAGIAVTDLNGQRVTFLHAFLRNLSKIVSSLILGIGYVMAAFTERRQALHDMMSKSLVVRTGPSNLLGVFIKAVIFFVVVGASCFAYLYMVVMPKMANELTLTVHESVQATPDEPPVKKQRVIKKAAAPKPAEPAAQAATEAAPETSPAVPPFKEQAVAKTVAKSQEPAPVVAEPPQPVPAPPSPVVQTKPETQATVSAPVSMPTAPSEMQTEPKKAAPPHRKHKTGDVRDCLSLPTDREIAKCAGG